MHTKYHTGSLHSWQTFKLTFKVHCGHARAGAQCSTKGFETSVRDHAQTYVCVSAIITKNVTTQHIAKYPIVKVVSPETWYCNPSPKSICDTYPTQTTQHTNQRTPWCTRSRASRYRTFIRTAQLHSGHGWARCHGCTKGFETSVFDCNFCFGCEQSI